MDTKSIEEKAKEFSEDIDKLSYAWDKEAKGRKAGFTSGYRADREDVVRVIEQQSEAYRRQKEFLKDFPMAVAFFNAMIESNDTLLTHLNLNS